MKSNVPLLKRIIILSLDVLFIPIISFGLAFSFLSFFNEEPSIWVTITILVLPVIIDQIILPYFTGYTTFRFISGYRILNNSSHSTTPMFWQLVVRIFVIAILETLITSIISLFFVLFRKDKRAIHEIISNTYCEESNTEKYFKVKALILFVMVYLLFCALIQSYTLVMYNNYLEPAKEIFHLANVVYADNIYKQLKITDLNDYEIIDTKESVNWENESIYMTIGIDADLTKYEKVDRLFCSEKGLKYDNREFLRPWKVVSDVRRLNSALIDEPCLGCFEYTVACGNKYGTIHIAESHENGSDSYYEIREVKNHSMQIKRFKK